ncbi:MAG: DUF2812 domain-containing protein [Tissierellia bacterium]|nr:DUF2812 domain-containing protein [Tissierellia bacterium]
MKKKIRMGMFSFYDNSSFERRLEEMAAKGWMLENLYGYLQVYRKAEARKLKFSVQYFHKASKFTDPKEDEVFEYREIMEGAGWKHLLSSFAFQIFYTEEEEPVPIETEPEVEYRNIIQIFKNTVLPQLLLLLFLPIFSLSMNVELKYYPLSYFSDNFNLIQFVFFMLVIFFASLELIFLVIWILTAKKTLRNGRSLPTLRALKWLRTLTILIVVPLAIISIGFSGNAQAKTIFFSILLFIVLSYIFLQVWDNKVPEGEKKGQRTLLLTTFTLSYIVLLVVLSSIIIRKERVVVDSNSYVHKDEIPIRLEDYVGTNDRVYSKSMTEKESYALKRNYYIQEFIPEPEKAEEAEEFEMEKLEYSVNKVKWRFLNDFF